MQRGMDLLILRMGTEMSDERSEEKAAEGARDVEQRRPYGDYDRRPPRRSTGHTVLLGCLITLAGGVTLLALLVGGVVILFFASATAMVGGSGAATGDAALQEIVVEPGPSDAKIVEVPVRGLLVSGGAAGISSDTLLLFEAMIRRIEKDPSVEGVILSVDSGGGAVTTCDVMSRAVRQLKADTGLPVVALLEDVAASGGYYVACSADHIIAHPTTITGSIGVLMPVYNANTLLKSLGVSNRTVKSGRFKDMASLTAEKTPEQWAQERAILLGVVNQMHEQFVGVVASGRNMDLSEVRPLADGRIYTSFQAQANGLVDGIGYREDAIARVKELAGISAARVVRYRRMPSVMEMLLAKQSGPNIRIGLADELAPLSVGQRPLYLWQPPAFSTDE